MVQLVKLLFFAVLGSAAALEARSAEAVLYYVKLVDGDTRNLTTALKSYKKGQNSTTILNGLNQLYQDYFNAWDEGVYPHSQPYTQKGADALCNYSNKTLLPHTETFVKTIISKKNAFTSDDRSTISSDLQSISDQADSLFYTAQNMSPGSQQATCGHVETAIDAAFNSAVSAYSN